VPAQSSGHGQSKGDQHRRGRRQHVYPQGHGQELPDQQDHQDRYSNVAFTH